MFPYPIGHLPDMLLHIVSQLLLPADLCHSYPVISPVLLKLSYLLYSHLYIIEYLCHRYLCPLVFHIGFLFFPAFNHLFKACRHIFRHAPFPSFSCFCNGQNTIYKCSIIFSLAVFSFNCTENCQIFFKCI